MTAMVILLVFLAVLGLASALGRTADSRDPEYGVGPFLRYARAVPRRS